MSSIRLFILDAFERSGEMHGYELRMLADRERTHQWTDVSSGAVYGAMKRLAAEGLLEPVRSERDGLRPERQVYAITAAGRAALATVRDEAARSVLIRPDPFDLALARLGAQSIGELRTNIEHRLTVLHDLLHDREAFERAAAPHLTLAEQYAVGHRTHLLRSEIEWHEQLLDASDRIADSERNHIASTVPSAAKADRSDDQQEADQ